MSVVILSYKPRDLSCLASAITRLDNLIEILLPIRVSRGPLGSPLSQPLFTESSFFTPLFLSCDSTTPYILNSQFPFPLSLSVAMLANLSRSLVASPSKRPTLINSRSTRVFSATTSTGSATKRWLNTTIHKGHRDELPPRQQSEHAVISAFDLFSIGGRPIPSLSFRLVLSKSYSQLAPRPPTLWALCALAKFSLRILKSSTCWKR